MLHMGDRWQGQEGSKRGQCRFACCSHTFQGWAPCPGLPWHSLEGVPESTTLLPYR